MVECSKRQDTSCPFCKAACKSRQQVSTDNCNINLHGACSCKDTSYAYTLKDNTQRQV